MGKIISLIILLTFLISNFAYPIESNSSDTLRVPLNSPELKERQQEVQRPLSLKKHDLESEREANLYIPGRVLEKI